VIKAISYTIVVKDFVLCLLSIFITGGGAVYLYKYMMPQFSPLQGLTICVSSTCGIYLFVLIFFKLLGKEDLKHIPIIKRWM
jgi:stage V sporulation protein B